MAEAESFEDNSRMSNLSKEAFEIEKVREKILLEVLLLPDGNKPVDKRDGRSIARSLSVKQAMILRSVSKTWMKTVTGHFREFNQPLFEFSIRRRPMQTEDKNVKSGKHESEDYSNSEESEVELEHEDDPGLTKAKEQKIAQDKLIRRRNGHLAELLDWINQNGGIREDHLPPISLKLESIAFLDADNFSTLEKLFTTANAAVKVIAHMSIMDPEDVLPLECASLLADLIDYSALEFPSLQTLELRHLTSYGINAFFVSFIQKILGCSKNLLNFRFKLIKTAGCEEEDDIDERQNLYQDLLFPPETLLKSVEVDTQMSLEPFLLANLSKLATLKIERSTNLPFSMDHLKQLLENCGQNLEELHFLVEEEHEDFEEIPAISLPLKMPRLKVLKLEGSFWKLAGDDVNVVASEDEDLRSRLPALEVFSANQCVRRLRGRGRKQREFKAEGNSGERVYSVLKSFPNQVAHLELNLAARETTGLTLIFKEMAHLESLKLEVDDKWEAGSAEDDDVAFEAALVGIPIQMAKKLRLNAMTLCSVYQKEAAQGRGEGDSGQVPSMRDLQNLKSFSLTGVVTKQAKFNTFTFQSKKKVELLSDLSFFLGFLEMRKLKELTLKGSFTASNMMIQNWNGGRDRTIDCDVSKQDSMSGFEHFTISNMEGPFDHRDFLGFPFVR